jgi:battenin
MRRHEDVPRKLNRAVSTEDKRPKASYLTLAGFFVAGLINNFGYVVMNSAALALIGTELPASLVLLANVLPGFLAQLAFPWFQDRIPYWVRVWATVVCGCGSFVLAALADEVYLRLIGVIIGSVGSCVGEMTFLAYSVRAKVVVCVSTRLING